MTEETVKTIGAVAALLTVIANFVISLFNRWLIQRVHREVNGKTATTIAAIDEKITAHDEWERSIKDKDGAT